MKLEYIDGYNYCSDKEKEQFYRNHEYTPIEKKKTEEFRAKMDDFVIKTSGEDDLRYFHKWCAVGEMVYREEFGYVTITNADRDIVLIYGYGKTIEEAFIKATIDYELELSGNIECFNRQRLKKEYNERFLNGEFKEEKYRGPFFFAELSLQDFRKYYGDNIPDEILDYFINYLKEVFGENYKYDYETNKLVEGDSKTSNK